MSEPATETIVPTESFEQYFTRANVAERDGTLSTLAEPEPPPVVPDAEPVEPETPPVEAVAEAVKVKKPRNDPQARIDEITAKHKEAERQAQAAVERAERAERELAATRAPKAEPVKPVAAPAFPDFATWSAQPGNDAKPYEDYIDARTDFRYEQRQHADQEQRATAQARQHLDTSNAAFRERLTEQTQDEPDFLDSVDPKLLDAPRLSSFGKKADGSWYDLTTGQPTPPPTLGSFLIEQVFQSEHPKALLRHLSDLSHADRQRLATLPPDQLVWQLAKAVLTTTPAASSGPAPVVPKTSRAPDPIVPLGSSPVVSDDVDETDLPLEQFIRRGNARDRKAGRRL